ncbi:hypothetical protein JMJ58_17255 [Haloterrigena salifodinae]|uniref:Uncharacterized protein n=1 Tax=Haloterrigena salifodinae TaxID=2675099 RepID=A0A8T8DZN9_9EURY|nr:hypothetical protein [Haloterrigena salifodinae]QRV14656.1 hypothetical protein JMJ58_17255 [Haloterrigena salifodinae]
MNPNSNNWTFLLPPDVSSAESIIGLDGTPNKALWKQTLNEEIQPLSLLSSTGKREYLQKILGLQLVQTTNNWKSVQSGEGAAPPKDLAVIEGIARKEGQTPALISSQNAIQAYRREGMDELTESTEHYGNLKGMNTFKTERLGIILGNPHPGDAKIQKWSAFAGKSAEPKEINGEQMRGADTDYGSYGNQVMETFIHDEVLQAAMRFGREETDGEKGATVYIHTCAFPSWLPVEEQFVSVNSWTNTPKDGVQLVIRAVRDLNNWQERGWSVREIRERIHRLKEEGIIADDLSGTTVRNWLKKLAEQGYLTMRQEGQGHAYHFLNQSLEDAPKYGHVEFSR